MNKFKGTQGEWKVIDGYLTTDEIIKENRCPIATMHQMQDGKNNEFRIIESGYNAKAIAALPELIIALQMALSHINLFTPAKFKNPELEQLINNALNEAL